MSIHTLDYSEIYKLIDYNEKLRANPRGVNLKEKEQFVQLAERAEKEGWAEKVMGGADVMADINETRSRVEQRLKNRQLAA